MPQSSNPAAWAGMSVISGEPTKESYNDQQGFPIARIQKVIAYDTVFHVLVSSSLSGWDILILSQRRG